MKKRFLIAITTLLAVMVSSCKKDNDELDDLNESWNIELTAQCTSSDEDDNTYFIGLQGTGTFTIDWGDGTILKNLRMPEFQFYGCEMSFVISGKSHTYNKVGTYSIKITGQKGSVVVLSIYDNISLDHIRKTRYTTLILDQCSQLQYLDCRHGSLTSLDVSRCTQLKTLWCNDNQLNSLDISLCTKLEYLDCKENQLNSLNVSGCLQLKELHCEKNQLTSLDVSGCTQLNNLSCGSNQLTSLSVSKCTQLKGLYCYGNQLPMVAMNKIYNDLPVVDHGDLAADKATAGDYYIAKDKGWSVQLW